jgi:pimeloyl-ACP methyl ester carboxylesterase
MNITPFKVRIAAREIVDLRRRLSRTRWPDEIPGTGWERGADLAWMKSLVGYWLDGFDWRAQEESINRFAQYRATVDGVGIHFIHQRGRGPDPLPILITHGWPGSFLEMLKILPLLTDPAAHGGDACDAFDVVVPSLPGYGFSDRPAEKGFDTARIASLWVTLMEGLGYRRFCAQGGDWGASVGTQLGFRHGRKIIGLHLNYIPGSYRPWTGAGSPALTPAETRFLEEAGQWYDAQGGYAHAQKTRPQTLAFGLNDSPAGLAAWIVEKFREWSDCEGDVERRFTMDELLTNVSLYWFTQTIHSSCRLYHESASRPLRFGANERVEVPCGVASFPKEAPAPPRDWVQRVYDVRRWTEMPAGGHFAAMEEPALLAADIREFFRPLRRKQNESPAPAD